ncbi:hypothetical protein [Aquimarina sp. 2201CG5-10]|uniref:hypothetical protein n=1 Tax=Aquimarina callyspongiae TaxID=3098150 RepID=UPI002AB58F4B|nr:hypothetical protein [Aquimarina sp. 2201CG5-10]MDY8135149.1 hypothetical protein [Aquimarina sp. 2201CG5-10]
MLSSILSLNGIKKINKDQQSTIKGGTVFYYCDGRLQPMPCKGKDSDNSDDANE